MRLKLILILVLVSVALSAERIVYLQEAIDAALRNNDELAAAGHEMLSSRWAKYSSLSSFLPKASVSFAKLKLDPAPEYLDYAGNSYTLDDVQTTATLQIVQPLLTGGTRLLGFMISRRLEEMAKKELISAELDTRTNAELKYLTLIESYQLLQMAGNDLESLNDNLTVARIKYETGVASEAEFLQMQSEMAAKEAALIDARMYYEISAADLANFCGFDERDLIPEELTMENSLEAVLENVDARTISPVLEELTLHRNLTIQTMEENVKLKKITRTMALSTSLPTLSLIYEKSWDDDFDLDETKDESASLMLTASLPLLPIADTFCNYRKEHHQVRKVERELNSLINGIKLQIHSTLLALLSSVKKMESSQLALDYAEKTLLQTEERYRNNLASANDLLNVNLLKQSSEIAFLQDKIDLIRYKSDLKKLLNLQTDEELIQLLINS